MIPAYQFDLGLTGQKEKEEKEEREDVGGVRGVRGPVLEID